MKKNNKKKHCNTSNKHCYTRNNPRILTQFVDGVEKHFIEYKEFFACNEYTKTLIDFSRDALILLAECLDKENSGNCFFDYAKSVTAYFSAVLDASKAAIELLGEEYATEMQNIPKEGIGYIPEDNINFVYQIRSLIGLCTGMALRTTTMVNSFNKCRYAIDYNKSKRKLKSIVDGIIEIEKDTLNQIPDLRNKYEMNALASHLLAA